MAQRNFHFVPTQRNETLVVDNFIFRLDKSVNHKRYWKCNTAGCRGTALTEGRNLIRAADVGQHDHVDDSLELSRRHFSDEVKATV
jgi:FLYWCH zinc finger domain